MELWDVYDKDRARSGRTMARGSAFAQDAYHLVVHVCLFNPQGQMLIQQRQPFKEGWPNLWDLSVGGSALAGESSAQAAERETLEEIGYRLDLSQSRPYLTLHFDHGFDDYYLLDVAPRLDALVLQPEEVQKVDWASRERIQEMMTQGSFIPYHPSLIDLLFSLRHKRGGHF